jgi:hypothetical protein
VGRSGALPNAAEPAESAAASTSPAVRTAIVFVHGKGETQYRTNETLDGFVKTALHPLSALYETDEKWGYHYSRAAELTGSYEARVYVAPQLDGSTPNQPKQGQTDVYDYDYDYLMTASRFAGVVLTTLRVFLRRPSNVPDPLFGVWRCVWMLLLGTVCLVVPALALLGYFLGTEFPIWVVGLVASVFLLGGVGLFGRVLSMLLYSAITTSFIDVARYLDPWTRSYSARRAVRGGMIDLLHELHEAGRYSRIVVVAHGVGTFIAYDALTALWAEYHEMNAGPPPPHTPAPVRLDGLNDFEQIAARLTAEPDATGVLDSFQNGQFALWQDLRRQGNPWRITDFVTVGAPLALADLLLTRPGVLSGFKKNDKTERRALFDALVRRGSVVQCPPRSETQPVEGGERHPASFRMPGSGPRELLGSQTPFAVTRWTNLWFPVIRGELGGDWFGGELRTLFGAGIRDALISGNLPGRLARGTAHNDYFDYPEADDEGDVAWHLRKALALDTHDVLEDLLAAPPADPDTRSRSGHHQCWRSDSWLLE